MRSIDRIPIASLQRWAAPILVACGTSDRQVRQHATVRLLTASLTVDKACQDVADVGHTDRWSHGGEALRTALREFLSRR